MAKDFNTGVTLTPSNFLNFNSLIINTIIFLIILMDQDLSESNNLILSFFVFLFSYTLVNVSHLIIYISFFSMFIIIFFCLPHSVSTKYIVTFVTVSLQQARHKQHATMRPRSIKKLEQGSRNAIY